MGFRLRFVNKGVTFVFRFPCGVGRQWGHWYIFLFRKSSMLYFSFHQVSFTFKGFLPMVSFWTAVMKYHSGYLLRRGSEFGEREVIFFVNYRQSAVRYRRESARQPTIDSGREVKRLETVDEINQARPLCQENASPSREL